MHSANLNSVCPYYTMFPLEFPLSYLQRHGKPGNWVLDPFCGRGTTNFAARVCGLPSVGRDTSSVAVAVAKAKLASATQKAVLDELRRILDEHRASTEVPQGEFWTWAYHPETLHELCRVREALSADCSTDLRLVLRAIVLGALHGPRNKTRPTYLSNQCPRTFAPKPDYAVRFWRKNRLYPVRVDITNVVAVRAVWYLTQLPPRVEGWITQGDSRVLATRLPETRFDIVITSPPYYGMRTYIPDQWLRSWFLGGPPHVAYEQPPGELSHASPDTFAAGLAATWQIAALLCKGGAVLLCRFGGIHDRKEDPLEILRNSLQDSGWRIMTIRNAGSSSDGKRQAKQFGKRVTKPPRAEFDIYARRI